MSQPGKISEAELAEIKMLQEKFQESTYKFGILQIEKIELDDAVTKFLEKEKKIKEEWTSLKKLEEDLLNKIVKNYGEGSLNINDGVFVPSK